MMNFPKDNAAFSWTRHIKNKMVFYHLSGAQILRVFRKPKRREEGIAKDTVAAMVPKTGGGKAARPEEIWIMYRFAKRNANGALRVARSQSGFSHAPRATRNVPSSRVTMISAWRYPGTTKSGERPPIPIEIAEELEKGIY